MGGLGAAPILRAATPSANPMPVYAWDGASYYQPCNASWTKDTGVQYIDWSGQCQKEARAANALGPDAIAFLQSCLAQKPPDVPLRTQFAACFPEAQKISSPVTPMPSQGVMTTSKWLVLGAAAAVVGYVVLKA